VVVRNSAILIAFVLALVGAGFVRAAERMEQEELVRNMRLGRARIRVRCMDGVLDVGEEGISEVLWLSGVLCLIAGVMLMFFQYEKTLNLIVG
jgi:hypothetical protein